MKVFTALQVAVGTEPFQETGSQEQQSRNNLQHLTLITFLFWYRSFHGKILMYKLLPQPLCLVCILSAFPKLRKLHSHRVWRGGVADKPLALIFTILTQSWPAPSEAATATYHHQERCDQLDFGSQQMSSEQGLAVRWLMCSEVSGDGGCCPETGWRGEAWHRDPFSYLEGTITPSSPLGPAPAGVQQCAAAWAHRLSWWGRPTTEVSTSPRRAIFPG